MILQPIVEGQGDAEAIPVLLRRLGEQAEVWQVQIARPHRRRRTQLVQRDTLQSHVRVAKLTPDCAAILVLFDADDDCPKTTAATIAAWAQEAAGQIPCVVVMANREYESWFLGAMESLRGTADVSNSAVSHPAPESPRDAKGELSERMRPGCRYLPTADQARLTARLDLGSAYRSCRSFRKLVKAFGELLAARGARPTIWPPRDWLGP